MNHPTLRNPLVWLLLLLSLSLSACSGASDASQEEAFDSVESYLDFAAGTDAPLFPEGGEGPGLAPYAEILPTQWRQLFDLEAQPYLVLIGSVYCEPCHILETTVLSAYRLPAPAGALLPF
ncbi:hypothetical protein [Anoxynatronum buryatiense]|uniref:Uncharacterized protein n=1 Tax=Anoxynatronum buryatiense TaxID=489973 RepID=A0AA45WTE0_9CLOT|nr:hypothetical protein [Anoxynatronum buryatiense]SMP38759.1 hypothetical protein SAMN06296020_101149 [Anoxynatronum buryatiense]